MKKLIIILLIIFPLQMTFADTFSEIKKKLKKATCMHFEFISIIESDIFETVDSTYGNAQMAKDGRYNIALGTDVYAYDLKRYFTYVPDNNQLIIEKGTAAQMMIFSL